MPPEHCGVQRFDTPVEDRRVAGDVFDCRGGQAQRFDELMGAAGRVQGNALAVQFAEYRLQPVFVIHGDRAERIILELMKLGIA